MKAIEFGPCCPQLGSGPTAHHDEQCLYLNIFTPLNATKNDRFPIMFWIHGGGNLFGCSSQSIPHLYNGTNIIAQGQQVIIVTMNYRLGVLGGLFLEELARENPQQWPTSGNYNLLDVQSALRWIQANIQKFGGDTSRVLIFGESAGGNLAVDLGACQGSDGLYHHIISQSSVALLWNTYVNRTEANEIGHRILKQVGCQAIECLRNISVSTLLEVYNEEPRVINTVIDRYFIPYYPSLAIEKGTYVKNVGVTIGHNLPDVFPICAIIPQMDSKLAINYTKNNLLDAGVPVERFDDVLNFYRVASCSSNGGCCQLVSDLLLDLSMLCNARRLLNDLYAKNNRNLYWYRFDCNPTCPYERMSGICRHTSEIAYVFGTVSNYASKTQPNCTWDEESRKFSAEVIKHWVHMAATGRPLASWESYTKESPNYYHITPYEPFSTRLWMGDCQLTDKINQEQVELRFESILQ